MNNDIERMVADLEAVAVAGDPPAQYDLSVLYRDLARPQLSLAHFDRAESLTRAAAATGLPTAVDTLRNWRRLRYAFRGFIEPGNRCLTSRSTGRGSLVQHDPSLLWGPNRGLTSIPWADTNARCRKPLSLLLQQADASRRVR